MADWSYEDLPPDYFTNEITAQELFDERHLFENFKKLQDFMAEITGKTFETIKKMNSYLNDAMAEYDSDNDHTEDSTIKIYEYKAQEE
jgi:hypothetical protein